MGSDGWSEYTLALAESSVVVARGAFLTGKLLGGWLHGTVDVVRWWREEGWLSVCKLFGGVNLPIVSRYRLCQNCC